MTESPQHVTKSILALLPAMSEVPIFICLLAGGIVFLFGGQRTVVLRVLSSWVPGGCSWQRPQLELPKSLLLALCLSTPGGAEEPYAMPGMKVGSAVRKVKPPTMHFLSGPITFFFFFMSLSLLQGDWGWESSSSGA